MALEEDAADLANLADDADAADVVEATDVGQEADATDLADDESVQRRILTSHPRSLIND